MDYSKAFDCDSHKHLLWKLTRFGINGVLLNWISDNLNGRKVIVEVSNSCLFVVLLGVHQGPFLFLLLINDILDDMELCTVSLYADDVKLG